MADIVGRRPERSALDGLLAGARDGRSGVVVLSGEAGIGKTALLERTRDVAAGSGFRVERSTGAESETQFAFAGLHQLCAPMLDRVSALPAPQEAAMAVALGLRGGAPPEGFLVGLATLSLLAEVAESQPLLCLVDDAQWLDEASAQILAFVARRLAAEQIALVFARRDADEHDLHPFVGVPELRMDGLGDPDARALLAGAVRAPLDEEVRERIVAEARGNPLALLELPRSTHQTHRAGGFELPDVMSVPRRVEDAFLRRSNTLPADTQMLLLAAAADPTGDLDLLWRAAAHLEIDREATAPAEAAGLVEIDALVRFRHPLVRSAVYRAAAPSDVRRAHRALAAATDPRSDPDRHAWHRAQAAQDADEEAAADLERSAGRARSRGGVAAAAAFLEQATHLTPEPADRARRALDAAQATHDAGAFDRAVSLLDIAAAGPLDRRQGARLELLRAQIAFNRTRDATVPGMLLDAARMLTPLDAALARVTYLRAIDAAIITGGLGDGRGVRDVAAVATAAPAPPGPVGASDRLLDALVALYTQGYAAGCSDVREALEALCVDDSSAPGADGDTRRWLWLASRTALTLYDDELLYALAQRNVRMAREAGDLAALPAALVIMTAVVVLVGELDRASDLIAEEAAITQSVGGVSMRFGRLVEAAWRGHRSETVAIHAAAIQEATARSNRAEVALAEHTLAVLHNGLGDHTAALDAAERACESLEPPHVNLALPELIEAAARAGQPERAEVGLAELEMRASASGSQWALGLAARSRALLSEGPDAEDHYLEAIERLGSCRMRTYLARTHLVYGEWLHDGGRRHDARQQLHTAHELLADMGANGFADRAARGLRATGAHPRVRSASPTDALTAHELNIARLVATGATNRDVGAQLFLSPRTIEAHLRSIFRKLDITSRRQLRDVQLR